MTMKIRLLIVDDELRFLENLARRLMLRGFDVTTAVNGTEALAAADRHDFDVALVDLKMPGMSGDVLLQRLKVSHPLTEVIILTGHGSTEAAAHCTEAGSYSYLQKPCETQVLLETVKDAYQQRVARKLGIDGTRMEGLLRGTTGKDPLDILQRLRELEEELTPQDDVGKL